MPYVFLGVTALIGMGLMAPGEAEAVIQVKRKPWFRTPGEIHHLQIARNGQYLVFTDRNGLGLHALNPKTQKLVTITKHKVGASFFISPDGHRVFYRTLTRTIAGEIRSHIKAYDLKFHKTVDIEETESSSGYLSYDPKDLRFHLLHDKGIISKRLTFPGRRLAAWQRASRDQIGRWVVSQKGVLWVTQMGFSMRRLADDGSGVQSFRIAPDGSRIAWATEAGKIYVSREGRTPRFIGEGFDPDWHPSKTWLVYAAATKIGHTTLDHDLRLTNLKGKHKTLAKTPGLNERWPRWSHDGRELIYTLDGSTDLFRVEFSL